MIRTGTITQQDKEFVETWENITDPTYAIVQLGPRGDEEHVTIVGRRQFMLTTEERLITQAKILDPKNDPFKNGSFRPVTVPETVTVESNPNALSDDEVKQVLLSSELAWNGWMEVIDSPQTLGRMLFVANKLADEGVDVKLSRFKQVQAKLAEVKPRTRIVQKDQEDYEKIGNVAGANRSRGGMSANYR